MNEKPSENARPQYRAVKPTFGKTPPSNEGSVPEAPGLVTRAARAVVATVLPKNAPDTLQAARAAVCARCHNRKPDHPLLHQPYCGLCGCPIQGKTGRLNETCPDNPARW